MSGTAIPISMTLTSSTLGVDTIIVGNAGTFNNDANTDLSAALNADLQQAIETNDYLLGPNSVDLLGTAGQSIAIDLIFNPGEYGEAANILLPEYTNVTGLIPAGPTIDSSAAQLDLIPVTSSLISSGLVTTTVSGSLVSVFTIDVGAPGTFNADATVDISAALNYALKSAPAGDKIDVIFNPGDYGEAGPILLPSHTDVTGNDAELNFLSVPEAGGSALMANTDSYDINNHWYLANPDGTWSEGPMLGALTSHIVTTYSSIVSDTDISVSGLIFNETANVTAGRHLVHQRHRHQRRRQCLYRRQ
jgi:hypothetical protein